MMDDLKLIFVVMSDKGIGQDRITYNVMAFPLKRNAEIYMEELKMKQSDSNFYIESVQLDERL